MKFLRRTRQKIAEEFVEDAEKAVVAKVEEKKEPIQEVVLPLIFSATALIPLIAIVGSLKMPKVVPEPSKIYINTVNIFMH